MNGTDWGFETPSGFRIVWWCDAGADEREAALDRWEAAHELEWILARNAHAHWLLVDLRRCLSTHATGGGPPRELREAALEAVRRGFLLLVPEKRPTTPPVLSAPSPEVRLEEAAPLAGLAETDKARDWIAIQLVDEDDRPVPFRRFEIILRDGTVHSGTLDAQGLARVEGIDPGVCRVGFPDFDETDWTAEQQ